MHRRLVALAALVLSSTMLAVVGQSGVARASLGRSPASTPDFAAIDPHQSVSDLTGVSCPTPNFCMAVGYFEDENETQPLAQRFNGTRWVNANARILSDSNGQLQSVSCTSSSFCMAVGDGSNSAIAQEWNGHSWSAVGTDSHASDSTLDGVSCPADNICVAVGRYDNNTGFVAMVQYWQGASFYLGPAAEETGDPSQLYSVSCPNTLTCMAVGTYEDSTGSDLMTEEDLEGTWTLEPATGTNPTAANEFLGVSCTATAACMAVGDSDLDGQIRALSYSWDGTSWARRSTPQTATAADRLSSVTCRGSADAGCVATGDDSDEPVFSDRIDLMSWTGTRWRTDTAPAAVAPYEAMSGVSCWSGSRCVAVGTEADTVTTIAFAVSLGARGWSNDSVPNPRRLSETLQAVSCSAATRCVAVGGYETPSTPFAEVWNGKAWKIDDPVATGHSSGLDGISCPAKNLCVAVGQVDFDQYPEELAARLGSDRNTGYKSELQGLVETWNGSTWSATTLANPAGTSESLTAVWCHSASLCVAVGSADNSLPDSWIWHGKSWTEVPMPATSADDHPVAIRCPSTNECLAAGSSASGARPFVEQWNGKRWSVMTAAGTSYPFFNFDGLACPATNRCTAVGVQFSAYDQQYNLIESWNGTKWSVVQSPNPAANYGGLAAVSCSGSGACLAAGPPFNQTAKSGFVLRWNGAAWKTVTLPTAATGEVNLLGVFTISPSSAVVVGWKFEGAGFQAFTLIESGGAWRAI